MAMWLLLPMMALLVGTAMSRSNPVAETPLGRLRGHVMTSRAGRKFLAFSGVPYAKPPVGELRFEPPLPLNPWNGTKDALEDGPWCVQYNTFELNSQPMGVEDCLYLSVYTHNLSKRNPVLVHFHGGAFISGNGAKKTGPEYLMDEDLVIIDVNYRLAMFGFLSFEDIDMPGNQGMKDQVQALRWVKQNIASFGGDPNRVTLVGESAGGVSVYQHTVSPLSKGLFHGGIAESGTSYYPRAISYSGLAKNTTMWLLSLVKCNYTTTKEAVACLRNKDAFELASQLQYMWDGRNENYAYFGPTLEPQHEGAFLVGPISKWKHEPVPMIIGMTSAEGLLKTLYMQYLNISYEWFYNNFEDIAPKSLLISGYSSEPRKMVKAIREYYFPRGKITDNDWKNLTTMYSDSYFTIGIMDGANEHKGDVYFYYFDYLGHYSLVGDANNRNDSLIFGAFHTDEIIYLWYNKEFENLQGNDLKLSKKLVKLWAKFAALGTPTPKGRTGIHWQKWTGGKHCYMNIDEKGFKMLDNFAEDRYRFWKRLNYWDNMK